MAAAQPAREATSAGRDFRRSPEEFFYTLTLDGRPAGSARWWAGAERNTWVIRRETTYGGPLVPSRKLEVSRLDARTGYPQQFTETTEGAGRGQYDATFDRRSGLVTVRQGRDEASIPYVADMHDPISLIQHLRELPEDVTTTRVPLAGGTVLVTRLPDQVLDTPWGDRLTRVYYLRPGVAVVYIEAEWPRRPLRFTQTLSVGVLDASVTRTGAARQNPSPERAPQARQGQARQPAARAQARPSQGRQEGRERPERNNQRPQPERQGQAPQQGQGRQRNQNERRPDAQAPRQQPQQAPPAAEPGAGGENAARRKRRRGRRRGQGQGQA